MTIEQLIDDLPADVLREVLAFSGYVLPPNTSEKCLRATVLDDYERGYIDGREIQRAVHGLHERAILDEQNHALSKAFAALSNIRDWAHYHYLGGCKIHGTTLVQLLDKAIKDLAP